MTRFVKRAERRQIINRAESLCPKTFARVLAACSDVTGGIDRELHAARVVLTVKGVKS
jgi:hypothetical protein